MDRIFQDYGIFGLRWKVERGALGGWGRSGVCLRFASPFGQPVAGYLPSVGSRSDDGYFVGSLWLGIFLRSVRGAMVGAFWGGLG